MIPNPISFYNLISNSNDSIGGNNGTDNSISYVSSGVISNCASYTTSSSRISLGDPTNLKFSGAHTISGWINLGGTNPVNLDPFVFKGNDGVDFFCIAVYWTSSTNLRYYINSNRTTNTGVTCDGTTVVDSNWHMITAVYTGSVMNLYWDSVLIGTTSSSITIDTTDNWYIGNTNTSRSVNKKMNSVGFWSSALSIDSIQKLYNAGRANNFPFNEGISNSLAAYWKLNESSGNASDSIGGYTLTNNNTVTYSSGKINNGANFLGSSSQYLSVNRSVGDSLDIRGNISFSFWAKLSNANPDGCLISTLDTGVNKRKFEVAILSSSPNIMRVQYNSNDSTNTYWDFNMSNYESNAWTHFGFGITVSGPSIIAKINGSTVSPIASSTSATSIQSSNAQLCIGRRSNATTYLTGSLDEVGIWSRALNDSELKQLYNGSSGLSYPFYSSMAISQLMR